MMISYAQNFEDVILERALKHVEKGFYIDVGAWSPDIDSVTRAFYERGWSGINIEPNPEFHDQLQERRPRDQNLRLAIGDQEGRLTMNFLGNPGLSTLDDVIADRHRQAGWSADRQEVQVTTLAVLWHQYVPEGQDVHFLKVDVEGLEEAVLHGNDWKNNRPWIVVVEATLPMSQVESYASWESILLSAGYLFAYADGLNRFYVSNENAALLSVFQYPPNVFDDFTLSRTQQAETRATQAETRATQAEGQLAHILESKIWRSTAPLRWAIRKFRRLQALATMSELNLFRRQLTSAVLRRMKSFFNKHPILLQSVLTVIRKLGLLPLARRVFTNFTLASIQADKSNPYGFIPTDIAQLSPHARQIYVDLKAAIERRQKENG